MITAAQTAIDSPGSATPLMMWAPEVATMLAVSTRLVWRLTATGELPAPIRLGRSTRWRRADIVAYVEGL